MADLTQDLLAAVSDAHDRSSPIYLSAGGTKTSLVGRDCDAQVLDISAHCGVIDYEPAELLVHARAGTTLAELTDLLAGEAQMLPFEPPAFGGKATLGGTLACNLSGPGRPWFGSVRDATMGLGLINGRAEHLALGGKVMKNVAGYDASRLQAGALGCLGLITDLAIKVLPLPEASVTLTYDMDAQKALTVMCERAAAPRPLTGACWVEGQLFLRLAGASSAVQATAELWGGEQLENASAFWADLRDMALPFFSDDSALWRLSTSPTEALTPDVGLIDWAGQQRWVRSWGAPQVQAGHAVMFAGGDRSAEVRGELDSVQRRLQHKLKQAFDPGGIFNPGRLYSWM